MTSPCGGWTLEVELPDQVDRLPGEPAARGEHGVHEAEPVRGHGRGPDVRLLRHRRRHAGRPHPRPSRPSSRPRADAGRPNDVVTWWRRTHFENSMIDALLQREHTPYREIGHRAVNQTLDRAGVEHTRAEVERLVVGHRVPRSLPGRHRGARHAARRDYRLDHPLQRRSGHARARHGARGRSPFDDVISVAAAGSFKPHVATYRKACELIGLAPGEVLFVANHEFDCVGAKSFGMRTAFVNRRDRPFGGEALSARPHRRGLRRARRGDAWLAAAGTLKPPPAPPTARESVSVSAPNPAMTPTSTASTA